MALVRWYEDEDYSCSHSTMYVSDSCDYGFAQSEGPPDPVTRWLTDNDCGTFVITSPGHLQCTAQPDEYHRVRLELHDAEPTSDIAGWGDVLEAPYLSGTGWVGTGALFEEGIDAHLELGPPGAYRVRVARRAAEDSGDVFLFQYWPISGAQPGPRYLARDSGERSAYWRGERDCVGADLRAVLWWADGSLRVSIRELAAYVLLSEVVVVDALRSEARDARLKVDGDIADLDAVLGLQLVGQRPRYQDDGPGSFWDGDPDDPQSRYHTMDEFAVEQEPEPAGPWGGGVLSPDPTVNAEFERILAEYRSERGIGEGVGGFVLGFPGLAEPQTPPAYLPPFGSPPAAGFVSGRGELITWADDTPAVLADLVRRNGVRSAHETVAGIVVASERQDVLLVRPDGTVEVIEAADVEAVGVDPAGAAIGVLTRHFGRRDWTALHWVDLATGERRSWNWTSVAWDDEVEFVGMHEGGMLLNHDRRLDRSPVTMRWAPGSAPEPMPWRVLEIDPHSVHMVVRDGDRSALIGPSVDRAVRDGEQLKLPPGGRLVCRVGDNRLTVTDAAGRGARRIVLPIDAWLRDRPVWESPHTLLVPLAHSERLDCDAVRVDLVYGTYERIDLGPWADGSRGFKLVHPLIR